MIDSKTVSKLELELQLKQQEIDLLNSKIESLSKEMISLYKQGSQSQLASIDELLQRRPTSLTLVLPSPVIGNTDICNKLSALMNNYFQAFPSKLPNDGEVFIVDDYSFTLTKKVFEDAPESIKMKFYFSFF